MKLTDEQKTRVQAWADEGATLNEIQHKLKSELGLSLTYMDTRFLVQDHKITLKPSEPEPEKPAAPAAPSPLDPSAPAAPAPGGVTVTVDEICIPKTLASGKVTFSDGEAAVWYLDQMGRLGLDPLSEACQPSEADLASFQRQLQTLLR